MSNQHKYYIGVKQVQAAPRENDGRDGYEVIYPDGYTSWSPKEVFEDAYLAMPGLPDRITEEMVDEFITGIEYTRMGDHTVVRVKLKNGFSIVEDSACVEAANYDEKLGVELATRKAKTQVFAYLGFLLAAARNGVSP